MTDRYPVDVYYVEHLDQVWIVNWRDEEDHGVKTIQVIREASQKKKHHTVHPEPIDGGGCGAFGMRGCPRLRRSGLTPVTDCGCVYSAAAAGSACVLLRSRPWASVWADIEPGRLV